jgi:Hsp70 protein/LCCL domain
LGVDFGTSNTVAMLQWRGGQIRPLLFDGSPSLPSSVCADPDVGLLVGRDAIHAARLAPERFEPHPKRRIDEPTLLLGEAEYPIDEVIGAVLRRVAVEARRVAGAPVRAAVLTYPAVWAHTRRRILVAAAEKAGLVHPVLVPEPIAAAGSFIDVVGAAVPPGSVVVVYDLGAGTFDASVVRRGPSGFEVLATEGLNQAGGLDIDAAVVGYLGGVYGTRRHEQWQRLTHPATTGERRANRQLWDDVRTAKEMLSRASSATIHIPLADESAPLGRDQFEQLARPILSSTVVATRAALAAAGMSPQALAGIFLAGGSSRIPLVTTLLQQAFGRAPTVVEQPELVVAEGGLRASVPQSHPPTYAPTGTPPPAAPRSGSTLDHPPPEDPTSPPARRRTSTWALALAIGTPAVVLIVVGVFLLGNVLRPDSDGERGGSDPPPSTVPDVRWTTDASDYADRIGLKVRYQCPAGGRRDTVWGTDVYTTDSSVCTAAVHARKISFDGGGSVTIVIRAGQDRYAGSERNGVTTNDWGSFRASFAFD